MARIEMCLRTDLRAQEFAKAGVPINYGPDLTNAYRETAPLIYAHASAVSHRLKNFDGGDRDAQQYNRLTGTTDQMVEGQRIDGDAVAGFVAVANIVIAHNADFDRKLAERSWPIFERKN